MSNTNLDSKTKTRALGVWMCTALVVGNMIGSGVFLLPASLAPFGGVSMIGWLLTAAGAICLALVFARLAAILPKEGGPYAYIHEAFGGFAGFWIAWGYWIALWAGNAALAVAATSYMQVFFPVLGHDNLLAGVFAISLIWIVTWINSRGARSSGLVAVTTTLLKLLPLAAVTFIGFFHLQPDNIVFNPHDKPLLSSVSATMALTLWAFLGLESASVPAGDVIAPEKTIPRATVLGTLIATVLYILSTVALMGLMPPAMLAASQAPFADAARLMWGDWGYYLVGFGAIVSCFGALNGWSLMQAHVPAAAAHDGLFPRRFAQMNPQGVPIFGLVLSSGLVTALMAMKYAGGDGGVKIFEFIILLATATTLLPYAFCSMALLAIMLMRPQQFQRKDYLAPLCFAGVGFAYSVWALYGSGADIVMWGMILLLLGLPVYVWQVKERYADPS
ncbi:amino acid permease [Chromobacterium haemolyticum]|uniref:amino acid permease n=1 Tax=Chromobacterium haemolyticum TaxID=394935 RepID=UPI002449C08E|nr:amino acid permease [Chromobacterium haemolyticum]MDH0342913.1 amino acid permease [Chromobacterium haemolyticum]